MNLTLLIPTKNRSDILIKTIDFYLKNFFSFKIIIADSSNKFHFEKTKNFIRKKAQISQVKLIGRNIEVLKQCEKLVSTKFVVYTGDDDFLCADNLKIFTNYLEKIKNMQEYLA